ncbi:proton-conducting transporter membrane subunit [Hydrogenobacter thermophilus]|uniref:proton-conducting transporter transmembrane domain-containing protein n=1 Tax=Hydrogenobacter thermophilus TaxID=940 RepID=UPI0030FA48B3
MEESLPKKILSVLIYSPLFTSLLMLLFILTLPNYFTVPLGFLSFSFRLESIPLYFSCILLFVSFYISLYTLSYGKAFQDKPHFFLFLSVFMLSMFFTIFSNDVISFLFFWELMSLSSFLLVISEEKEEVLKTGFLYLFMTHLGTAFIILAFFLLYAKTASFSFDSFKGMADALTLFLALTGFFVKAGIVPFHVWLPHAHPIAPSNVSALMSGVMLNVAIYGMFKFLFDFSSQPYAFISLLLIILGNLSLFYGALYAFIDKDIKRFLAYSSIENVGAITIGMGVAYFALQKQLQPIYSLAVSFVLLHLLNHSLLKSSLFMGAGIVVKMTHEYSMNKLGGLYKVSPGLFLLILVASLYMSALPPSNMFLSELLLYKALFSALQVKGDMMSHAFVLLIAALALSGVFIGATFVKFLGLVFLGKSRGTKATDKPNPLELLSISIPVVFSILVGTYPYFLSRLYPYNYPLYLKDLSYTPLSFSLILFLTLLIAFYFLRTKNIRVYETWMCGLDEENPSAQATVMSQTYSIRRLFSMFYSSLSEVSFDEDVKKYFRRSVLYKEELKDVFEDRVYKPLVYSVIEASNYVRKFLQTGNINLYISYIFLTLALCFLFYILFIAVRP